MFSSNTTQVSDGGYQISRSLRFNSADTAYLNRTPASAGNRKTWTFSAWVKRSALSGSSYPQLMSADGGTYGSKIGFFNADEFWVDVGQGGGVTRLTSTAVYRDVSAWYHVVVAQDTTQATDTNRVKVYINGSQITLTGTYPAQNFDGSINNNSAQNIGRETSASYYFNGYITETYMVDGQALTPSSFGETNAQTGVWQPKAYSGSYGTNGFYLNFSDNSNTTAATLGKDYSGNGNNWTPNNFSVTAGAGNDSLVDSPTSYGVDTGVGGTVRGNYATINPLQLISNVAVTNGNLYLQSNNNQDQIASAPSTIAVRTGKWYAEFTASAVSGTPQYMFGVARAAWSPIILDGGGYYGRFYVTSGGVPSGYAYHSNSNFYTNGASVGTGATYASGDIIGIAMDLDAGSITFYKNGVSQGTPFTSIPLGVDYVFAGGVFTYSYPTPTNIGAYFANFGQRPFAYTAPSGFKALCTQNLPTPTIGATTATQAGKYFNPVLYTGNSTTNAITGVGFSPDFTWFKSRNNATNHAVNDSVRGINKILLPNLTNAEITGTTYLNSIDSDGFTLANDSPAFNYTGYTYVAWNWKANGSGSTNTAGSITSTVSANTTSGFSVVTYSGNSTLGATVGHGLGVAPSMIIVKSRNGTTNWPVYHASIGNTKALFFNLTNATDTDNYWNNTSPTSTVFSLNASTGLNSSGSNYVAYCFAEVAGYSKFGSYTGNGSTNGPFCFTGFRPAFVLTKRTDSTSDWQLMDSSRNTYNVANTALFPNTADADTSGYSKDFLSNGFKIRDSGASLNASGGTYIYMAFASNPFKFALAR